VNPLAATFISVSALALLVLPRRWAPLPLIVGTCYMTMGQGLEVGPFSFTAVRLLVGAGAIRVVLRGERLAGKLNALDWLMIAWSTWAIANSPFHTEEGALTFRLGLVYNQAGIYFLLRIFCQTLDDVVRLCRATAFLLVPVAVEMAYEHAAFHNLFSIFGGVPDVPQLREGKIRAFGPFSHPILAGTVGAVTLPLMAGLWREYRTTALVGIGVCLFIVMASASSGPFMSAMAAIAGLCMWPYRMSMQRVRRMAVAGYILVDLIMTAPAYYLIARVDVFGGSTGFHRARLIESGLEHLGEWWLTGTDFTRHWMPTGVSWSPNHTDITNHYLYMGVLGGLPLMFLFIFVMVRGFSFVGKCVRMAGEESPAKAFFPWALGASLFAHAATEISVSYFDQSFVFLFLSLAACGSAYAAAVADSGVAATPAAASVPGEARDLRVAPVHATRVLSPAVVDGRHRPSTEPPSRIRVRRPTLSETVRTKR
jgi:hypothetical protein